jgi:regulator of cell morphogenesis and NO signaling
MSALNQPLSLADQPIGEIAVQIPGSTALFRQLKLDFCCGGQVALGAACAAKGLDVEAVVRDLQGLTFDDTDVSITDPSELIDHILYRYHNVHRKQLPELIRMARRVEAVHRDHPAVPVGLAVFLEDMEQELIRHMLKEEEILFPMLKRNISPMVSGPISVMRSEHTDHGANLDQLAVLTSDHTPPAGACNTWRTLFAGTAQLTDDLIAHIHLENNVLFPQFELRT